MMQLNGLLKKIAQQFEKAHLYFGHGTDNAWDEACFLILSICGLPMDSDKSVGQRLLSKQEQTQIETIAAERVTKRVPLAYLLKTAWFAGLTFYVDERVIIPRSSFSELIQTHFKPYVNIKKVTRVLDLCTGSGCIAIALAHYFPHLTVDAVDISKEALAVAKRNIKTHGLEKRVRLIQSDLFTVLEDKKYDLILSNPPYVDAKDMATLPAEYRREPALALASGKDGLDLTKKILQQAKDHLTPTGVLMVEVGNSETALKKQYPRLPLQWLRFQQSEGGVFMMTAQQLK